jgi:methyl-accepting chemotaxis protein
MLMAVVVPLAVLVPVATVTLAATGSNRRTSKAAAHSTDVLQGGERLLLAAVDSETGIRGFLIGGDDRFLEPWNSGRAAFDAEAANLRQELAGNTEQLTRLERMVSVEQQWRTQLAEPQIAARRAGSADATTIERAGTGRVLKDQVRTAGADLVAAERTFLDGRIAANDRAVDRARVATVVGLGLVTLILLFYALALARTMQADAKRREALQSAVEQCSLFSSRVAGGDLTARLSPNGDGDLNRLYDNLNGMVSDLGGISRALRSRANEIGQATNGVLAAVSQHASTANQQSAAIAQIAATVSEVRLTAEQTAGKAAEVATLAQGSARTTDDGLTAVRSIVDGMTQIKGTLDRLATGILDLAEQAAQIDEIIATVNDFADQSNLLALNASIEAAKAGDQGRGFAVVAAEVRNLADQSKEATAAVRTILGEIQRATNTVVRATEVGARSADERSGQATHAGEVIGELKGIVHQAAQAAQVIAVSAHEQSVGMDQIAAAIGEIRDASTSYAEGSAALQRSASDLDGVAIALRDLTSRYQVEH